MLNVLSKTKTATVADLEAAVADAKTNLDRARELYRERRLHLEDCKALYAESDTIERRADLDAAYEASRAASEAVASATDNVKAAERKLDLSRTGPQRQASAQCLNQAADQLAAAIGPARKAISDLIVALDACSFGEVCLDIAPAMFAQMVHHAHSALGGGDDKKFIDAMRSYAAGIVDGSHPANLQPTLADQRTRKTG